MPRLELTLSPNLHESQNLPAILQNLTNTLATCPTIESAAIKSYAHIPTHATTGLNAPKGFVHLTVHLLTGRPIETRKLIADTLASQLAQEFQLSLSEMKIGITVEVREMNYDTFTKIL